MRWTKARKNINNVKFAELIGVSDKTVTNMLNYETHDRLDDAVVSKIALVLGFGPKVDALLIDANRRVVGPKKSQPPARPRTQARKP